MADSPPNAPLKRAKSDSDAENEPGSTWADERTPRWVKVFGIIALALVLIVAVIHLRGGGLHGHGMR